MKRLDVTRAFDGVFLESIELADAEQVESALEKAQSLYELRQRWLTKAERIEILEKTSSLMRARVSELAACIVAEGGKPLRDARVEVERAIEGVRLAAQALFTQHGTEIPMGVSSASAGRWAVTYHEPRGVVVAISAFNHPLNLIVHQVAPAVAAGCPVIVKPSLSTPLSCRHFVEILREAGLPAGWCQMLVCDNELSERLVTDPRNAFLSFIGSANVGWKLRSVLPPGAACALEHGGLAPMIVDETADWLGAIDPLLKGCFYHAGQVCVSGQRLYLHESIYDEFIDRFVPAVEELRAGDPADPVVDVGPLISEREVARVDGAVTEAVNAGAEVLCGGKRITPTVYAPTVLAGVPSGSLILEREIFGPVVCVSKFARIEEAITSANSVPEFFQAAVFTRDLNRALSLSRELHGMAVMVNDHSAFRVDWMPFGGHRSSGLGVGGIGKSMREMSIERMVVFKTVGSESMGQDVEGFRND